MWFRAGRRGWRVMDDKFWGVGGINGMWVIGSSPAALQRRRWCLLRGGYRQKLSVMTGVRRKWIRAREIGGYSTVFTRMTIWSYNSWAEGINLAVRRPTFYEQRAEVEKVKKKETLIIFFRFSLFLKKIIVYLPPTWLVLRGGLSWHFIEIDVFWRALPRLLFSCSEQLLLTAESGRL